MSGTESDPGRAETGTTPIKLDQSGGRAATNCFGEPSSEVNQEKRSRECKWSFSLDYADQSFGCRSCGNSAVAEQQKNDTYTARAKEDFARQLAEKRRVTSNTAPGWNLVCHFRRDPPTSLSFMP